MEFSWSQNIIYFRKMTLVMNNALVISGGIFLGVTKVSNSVAVLIIGRILVGINAGMTSCLLS